MVFSNPIIMTSVPHVGTPVFVKQPIIITCTTYETQVLAWESVEYIGPLGQLPFTTQDTEGKKRNSMIMDQTFAILTRNTITEGTGVQQLESQLHLTVASKYQTFTITCRNVDYDLIDNVTFHISGKYKKELAIQSIYVL